MPDALLAEFTAPDDLLRAATALRARGLTRLEAYTPFPLHGLDDALGLRRSPIPFYMFVAGLAGATAAYFIQWWTNAVDYPLLAGGRPADIPVAFVPITFEMMVLAAAFTAFFSVFGFVRLPTLYRPIFAVEGFERATIDRFFLEVPLKEGPTPDDLVRDLEAFGAVRVVYASLGGTS